MESLTFKQGETTYLLFNLTIESVREFKNDSKKLTEYFTNCLRNGSNICIQENGKYSSVLIPSTSGQKSRKFSFLCGTFYKRNFIYAIKSGIHPWHYFSELDSIITQHHGLLPTSMSSLICGLDKVRSINVKLNEEQSKNYFDNGKFKFRNKELKTFMELRNIIPSESGRHKPSESKSTLLTTRLVFVSGQTNPLLFLDQYEKCHDVKTDNDKMYKIRHFVDECHKAEFAQLYFFSNWHSIRSAFLRMYSFSFAENKKRELDLDFNEASTLRSFIERKLMSLSKFTTLPFFNQMEMALNDLPIEISSLFIVNEKMTCNKHEILDFCDSIKDLVEAWRETTKVDENEQQSDQTVNQKEGIDRSANLIDPPANRMEIFNFIPFPEPMDVETVPESSRGRGRGGRGRGGRGRGRGVRGRGRGVRGRGIKESSIKKRGRPPKKLSNIIEVDGESSDYDFLNQMDSTSRSSWSEA